MGDFYHHDVVLLSGSVFPADSMLLSLSSERVLLSVLGLPPGLLDPLTEESVGDDVAEDLRRDVIVDCFPERVHGRMGIAFGALHQRVAEDVLQHDHVLFLVDRMAGESVPETVRGDLWDTERSGLGDDLLEVFFGGPDGQAVAFLRDEQCG